MDMPQARLDHLRNGTFLAAAEDDCFEAVVTARSELEVPAEPRKGRIALIVLGSNRWTIVRLYTAL
jgi:hypothetical protein